MVNCCSHMQAACDPIGAAQTFVCGMHAFPPPPCHSRILYAVRESLSHRRRKGCDDQDSNAALSKMLQLWHGLNEIIRRLCSPPSARRPLRTSGCSRYWRYCICWYIAACCCGVIFG
mmetsp:Transcript_66108/g.193457  ORF Transcript_66108/g.193457 Transcript_66108/m.193457 type:complete len:117 (-) Transcript_66108:532-882(-)